MSVQPGQWHTALSLMFYCHYLEILNNFLTRAQNSHFTSGPTSYIVSSKGHTGKG